MSSYQHSLSGLSTREAITDALYRSIRGWDHNDTAAFNSSFIGEEIEMEMKAGDGEGMKVNSLSQLRDGLLAHVGPMDTTHMISNIRIDVKDGADTAALTCYALAQHCPPGRGKEPDGPKFLVGGEYTMEMVKDQKDGLWKIRKWLLDVIWRQGDAAVMGR